MQRERISHFLAVFSGILIGALTAQSIANAFESGKYFWFLGALLGGAVAWIGVDLKKFAIGTKLAATHAWNQMVAWKPDWKYWKGAAKILAGVSVVCADVYFANDWFTQMSKHLQTLKDIYVALECFFCFLAVLSSLALSPLCEGFNSHKNWAPWGWDVFRYGNPIVLILCPIALVLIIAFFLGFCLFMAAIKGIPILFRSVIHAAKRTPSAIATSIRFLRRFAQLTFLYTNNERRTASFVFAAIGVSAGYFVGYIPIVALIGAVVGVLEFELTKNIRERMLDRLGATV